MVKKTKIILSLLLIVSLFMSVTPIASINTSADTLSDAITDMSDTSLSSIQFVEQKLKIGYNIGNQFDGCIRSESYTAPTSFANDEEYKQYWETLWTNPVVTQTYIDYLKECGIQLIRLPVSWYNHLDSNNVINSAWLDRVQEVVDMIIDSGMYCMINIHHDGCISYSGKKIILDEEHRESTSAYLKNIWTQVGTRFQDYGTKLLFEGFNEPGDSSKSMSPSDTRQAEAALQINVFIKTIRDLGGNNAERFLVCPGYAGLSFPAYAQLVDTADDRLIATIHSYYTGSGFDTYYSANAISASNMGYIIDEIGSSSRRPDSDEGALASNIRTKIDKVTGLGSCWWDNGMTGEYCLVNRYYGTPVNYKTLSAYVGKDITPQTFLSSELTNSLTPNYAKFYTEDNTASGKKYFVIASQNKITSITNYSNYQCYYSFSGAEDGYVTVYESDDNINYYRLDTRYINEFSYAKWKFAPVLGSTELTYWIEGNYTIPNAPSEVIKHDVSIDGTSVSTIIDGKYYLVPSSSANGFIAYTDGTNFYKPEDTILVDKDINLTTLKLDLTMSCGAAMRLNEQTGIRFYTNVDTAQINLLKSLNATLNMGTIIAHSRRIAGNEVTLDLNETNSNNQLVWINVPYSSNEFYTETKDGSTFTGIVGSLVSIYDSNANSEFIGRGYISVTVGSITKTIYANYYNNDMANNSRSVSYIANCIQDDTAEYESHNAYKDIIDHYAQFYDDPIDPSYDDIF